MNLSEEMQLQQRAAEELEAATDAWKQAMAAERAKYDAVLICARRAKARGIRVPRIIEVTGISRSSLYTATGPSGDTSGDTREATDDSGLQAEHAALAVPDFTVAEDSVSPAWLASTA